MGTKVNVLGHVIKGTIDNHLNLKKNICLLPELKQLFVDDIEMFCLQKAVIFLKIFHSRIEMGALYFIWRTPLPPDSNYPPPHAVQTTHLGSFSGAMRQSVPGPRLVLPASGCSQPLVGCEQRLCLPDQVVSYTWRQEEPVVQGAQ